MQKSFTYFPGLDALRFFAAFLVIIHHLEQYKFWAGWKHQWGNIVVDLLGHQPVSFFFVLSGFLITYLLLKEVKKTNAVNVPLFYWKRILRIWPLYFIIVGLALWVFPLFQAVAFPGMDQPTSLSVVIPLLLFIPNLLRINFPTLIGGNQLWSVGIEEQFYLIWPLLIHVFRRYLLGFLISFLLLKLMGHAILLWLTKESFNPLLFKVLKLYELFPIEQMIIGGLGAYILFDGKNKVHRILIHPVSAIMLMIVVGLNHSILHLEIISTTLEGLFFLIVILQVIDKSWLYRPLEARWLKELGKVSYGIYMWHTLAIAICLTGLTWMNIENPWILGLSSIVLTLVLAFLSYHQVEKRFLKYKSSIPTFRSVVHGHA